MLLNSSLFSELNRAAAAAPPTPLPGHHSPGLIPQAGGLTAALQRAAEQTSTVTPKRAVTGIPPSSVLSTARLDFVGDQAFVINQTGGSRPPSAQLVIPHNPPITFRAHPSVNARRSLQKRKQEGKAGVIRGQKGSARGEARMEALIPALKSHPGLSVLAFSLIFRGVNRLLQQLPVPKVVKQNDFTFWKWKNLSLSMVHSLLTGTWALTW